MFACSANSAFAHHQSIVYFTHPTPATGKSYTFATGDRNFHVFNGGKCGQPYLGGSFQGMPDPRKKDPTQVCGWGKVYIIIDGPGGGDTGDTGPAPVSILPIEAPMPVESSGGAAVDAAKLIRDMLPKIVKSDGDKMPVVIQIRDTIRSLDVLNGAKSTPKRQARQ